MSDETPTRLQVGFSTYAGLFFVTLSTLMYEILLTRIFSVTMWYHFAFVAVSVALFGMTVGALIVYLAPGFFPQERTKERLAQSSLLFSVSIVVSFVTQLSIPFQPDWSILGIYSVALLYLVISVPFIFSGIAVSLALTRFPTRVSRLYGVDLVGAGLGTVSLIWLLDVVKDGPSAVLAVGGIAAVGAAFFARGAGRLRGVTVAAGVAVILLAMAAGNAVSVQNQNPMLKVRWMKGVLEGSTLYEAWNPISRVAVQGNMEERSAPHGWGMSRAYQSTEGVRQLLLSIDASSGTPLTYYDGDKQDIRHLRYDVTNVVHYLRPKSDVLIIGSGGGRDVLTSLLFDQKSATALELNGEILDIANERFGDFTGHLDQQAGVRFVNDEARSYLARSDERYDIIQISLIDTWAATAAGAFALSENSLYTVEAWQNFLEHLEPGGVLSVSRWYVNERPMEAYRLTALAAESLRRAGVSQPSDHMMLVKSPDNEDKPGVGTMLVSMEPFSAHEVALVGNVASSLEFDMVLAPNEAGSKPIFSEIVQADDPTTIDLGIPVDISAPTDDRPYFFQMIRFQDIFDPALYGGADDFLTKPVLVLFSLAIAVLSLTALCILFPLLLTTSRKAMRGMTPLMVFFAGIGLGFLLLEISQMQRLVIFLGHPTYALSVVLFSLLIASGLGSLATERLTFPGLRPMLLAPFGVLLAVLVISGLLTPTIIDQFEDATTPIRIMTAAAILAPMGLMMGMPFPVGMRVAALRPNAPTAFFWGINGATSVCASVLAVAISMSWGISLAFWVGCVSYAMASAAIGLLAIRGRF